MDRDKCDARLLNKCYGNLSGHYIEKCKYQVQIDGNT